MGRTCFFPGCGSRDGHSVSFYTFPEDDQMLRHWTSFCGREPTRRNLLCSVHFDAACFRDPTRPSKGLLKTAVPTVTVPDLATNGVEFLDGFEAEVRRSLRNQPDVELIENCATRDTANKDDQIDFRKLYQMERRKRKESDARLRNVEEKLKITEDKLEKSRTSTQLLKRRCARQDRRLAKNKVDILTLKKQVHLKQKLGSQDRIFAQAVRSNPVLRECILNSICHKNGRRYAATRLMASRVKFASTSGYRALRSSETITLPHPKTVVKWQNALSIRTGFNEGVFKRIRMAGRKMSESEKVVAVLIDGMALKSMLTYHAKSDRFTGFPDDGEDKDDEKNDPKVLANEGVAIMVRSIHGSYKQILGHFLADSTIESRKQGDLIQEAIRRLRDCGFHPVVLILDQHAANRKMTRLLGATEDNPTFDVDGQSVVMMYDTPHLVKSVRNNLLKKNLFYNGEIVSFSHLVDFYEIDSQNSPRFAPKFDLRCLVRQPFDKMNVGCATKVFSTSTCVGVKELIKLGKMSAEASPTADFCLEIDTYFDIFNSVDNAAENKPYRKSWNATDHDQISFLERFKTRMRNAFYVPNDTKDPAMAYEDAATLTSAQRQPPCLSGIINNLNALPLLWKAVEGKGFESLCLNKVSQDALENGFASIRRSCGSNEAPNAFQFGVAVRNYSARKTIDDLYGANCCMDDTTQSLVDEEDFCDTDVEEDTSTHITTQPFEPLDLNQDPPDLSELNALTYIVGYAASKLKHKKCKNKLLEPRDNTNDLPDEYSFVNLKKMIKKAGVSVPKKGAYDIGFKLLIAFSQKFWPFIRKSKTGVKSRLKQYTNHADYKELVCRPCFEKFIDRLLNTLLNGQTKKINGNHKRRNVATVCAMQKKGRRKNIFRDRFITEHRPMHHREIDNFDDPVEMHEVVLSADPLPELIDTAMLDSCNETF